MRPPSDAPEPLSAGSPADGSGTDQPAAGKLDIINGLRGAAIVAVIWHHLFGLYFKAGSVIAAPPDVARPLFFLSYGWIGVQLFFVLSGFVLYLPFTRGRARLATSADWHRFYRRRAARLLPLYYLVALLCLVLNQVPPIHDLRLPLELVSIAGALFTFAPHGFEPHLNPPLWSLGVEIWFSILFPAVILAFRRWGPLRTILAATALAWLSRSLGLALSLDHPNLPLTRGLTANLEVFAVGMALAQAYVTGIRLRWPRLVTFGGAALIALALLAAQVAGPWFEVVFTDVLTLGFAAIIAGLLSLETGWLRASFANRPIQVLGMMCFSLYVWHEPLLRHVFNADAAPLQDLARTLPLYLFLLLAIAALSYRFIEFGRTAHWRALFLLDPPPAPVAVPTVPVRHDADLG